MIEIMIEQLPDYLNVIVGMLALILSFIVYKSGKKRKELSYLLSTERIAVTNSLKEGLKISYNGEVVNHLSMARFLFVNSGNVIIDRMDVSSDNLLRIKIDKKHRVLGAEVRQKSSVESSKVLDISENTVTFSFGFLNPHETILIGVLVDSYLNPKYEIKGRVKGISEINLLAYDSPNNILAYLVLYTGSSAIIGFLIELLSSASVNALGYIGLWMTLLLLHTFVFPWGRKSNRYDRNLAKLYETNKLRGFDRY